jgi:hypothetical protein
MAEIILFVDIDFGGAHTHLYHTTNDVRQLTIVGAGIGDGVTWNDQVSSFKIVSGTWKFYRDINLTSPFTDLNTGEDIMLSDSSPGTPSGNFEGGPANGEFPTLPGGFDNDALSSVRLVGG